MRTTFVWGVPGRMALVLCLSMAPVCFPKPARAEAKAYQVYVGTYTGPKSKGIYTFRFDPQTGLSSPLSLAAETQNPTFLAVHPNRHFLYAVNEVGRFQGTNAGAVSAFRIDASSPKLTLLNQVSTVGTGPCHLAINRGGRCLVIANYSGGSVAAFPIKGDGSLGEASSFIQHHGASVNKQRQEGPHAHGVTFDVTGRRVFVPDLGMDKILSYRIDAAGAKLFPDDPPAASLAPGSGPRHLVFHPNGNRAYCINELLSTITVFDYDGTRGALRERQTVSTLPDGFSGASTSAEIAVHPNGRFLYGSNRGHDSIAVYSIATDGTLKLIESVSTQGKTPRNFAIDPVARWLWVGNQTSDSLVALRLNGEHGTLTSSGQVLELAAPVCVVYVRLGD